VTIVGYHTKVVTFVSQERRFLLVKLISDLSGKHHRMDFIFCKRHITENIVGVPTNISCLQNVYQRYTMKCVHILCTFYAFLCTFYAHSMLFGMKYTFCFFFYFALFSFVPH